MIDGFKLIKYILSFMFFSSFFKILIVKFTGSYLLGSLFIEASIFIIFFFFITYLMKEGYYLIRLDWVKILLFLLLIGSVVQSIYFISIFNDTGLDLFVRAFASFRKYFFPLILFWVFTHVLLNKLRNNNDQIFAQLLKFLNLLLFIAVFYQIAEAILRLVPAFNSFYANNFIAPAMNAEIGSSSQLASFTNLTKTYFPFGIRINLIRVFGIGLDYFVSGSIIFLCYMYKALFSPKFKMLSLFNLIIFIAIFLSGTLQFILPFLLFNVYLVFKRTKTKAFFKLLTAVLLICIVLSFGSRVFDPASGYGSLYLKVLPDIMENINMFYFGLGPFRTNLNIEKTLIDQFGPAQAFFLENITDIGVLTMAIEIGLILYILFFAFYLSVIFSSNGIKGISVLQKETLKKLKFINLFGLLVFISHYLIFFSRTTISFSLLLLSLLYSYSIYLKGIPREKSIN